MNFKKQPWTPADATDYIHAIAQDPNNVVLKIHAKERMEERGITILDVLYVLRNGFVCEMPIPATREVFFKYKIEIKTQNSKNRIVRAVVIPDGSALIVKIITVMFADK